MRQHHIGGGGHGGLYPQITPKHPFVHRRVARKYMMPFGKIGRREWDRTTDHHHVKVMLYH